VKGLKDTELKMAAEITLEIAKGRGRQFDRHAAVLMLRRAALADPAYRARLAEVHRRSRSSEPARSRAGCSRRSPRSSVILSGTPSGSSLATRAADTPQ